MTNGTWKGLEPEYALLGGILKQAIRDSRQVSDGKLRREAWEFLQNCAPVVAEKVGKGAKMVFFAGPLEKVYSRFSTRVVRGEKCQMGGEMMEHPPRVIRLKYTFSGGYAKKTMLTIVDILAGENVIKLQFYAETS